MTYKKNINEIARSFIVSLSGDDDEIGTSLETAKQTLNAAVTAVNALSPPSSITNPTAIITSGAGLFTENVDLPDACQFDGENIFNFPLTGDAFAPASNSSFEILSTGCTGPNSSAIRINGRSTIGVVAINISVLASATNSNGIFVDGASDDIFIRTRQITVEGDGSVGIRDENTSNSSPETYTAEQISLEVNNSTGMVYNPSMASAAALLQAGLVGEVGSFTGTTGLDVLNGNLEAFVSQIIAVDAIHVAIGATLDIVANDIQGNIVIDSGGILNCKIVTHSSGTITNNGTINGLIDTDLHGNFTELDNFTIDGTLSIGGVAGGSAKFQMDTTTQGFLMPRQTTTERDAISSPATGLQIYNTTNNRPEFFDGSIWTVPSAGSGTPGGGITDIQFNNPAGTFDGNTDFTFTDSTSKFALNSPASNRDAMVISVDTDTNDAGIAFANSAGTFNAAIFREDIGSNRANLIFSAGLQADPDNLTDSMRIRSDVGNEGDVDFLQRIRFPFNSLSAQMSFGSTDDFNIFHDGLTTLLNTTGNFNILTSTDDLNLENSNATGFISNQLGSTDINTAFIVRDNGSSAQFAVFGNGLVTVFSNKLEMPFDQGTPQLSMGSSAELSFFHDGANSNMTNTTGDLIIENTQATSSIINRLGSTDGSTTFEIRDSSNGVLFDVRGDGNVFVNGLLSLGFDSSSDQIQMGAGGEFGFFFDGNDSNILIDGTGGNLIIDNTDTQGIIINRLGTDTSATGFEVRNNSDATLFEVNGAGTATLNGPLLFPFDGTQQIRIGAGDDLRLDHDGTNSRVHTVTGNLIFQNDNATGDIVNLLGTATIATSWAIQDNTLNEIFKVFADGEVQIPSGSELTMPFDSTEQISMGVSGDLKLHHDGISSFINNITGDLNLTTSTGDMNFTNTNATGFFITTLGSNDTGSGVAVESLAGDTLLSLFASGTNLLIGSVRDVLELDLAAGVFRFDANAFRAGESSTNYTEIGHGGSNAFINAVGTGLLEFRHENTSAMSLTAGGVLMVESTSSQQDNFTVRTTDNANDVGIAFEQSGGFFNTALYHDSTGTVGDFKIAKGAAADVSGLTEAFVVRGAAPNVGRVEIPVSLGVGSAAQANAILTATSTTEAFMPPRWTTGQETTNTAGFGASDEGLMWYNTSTNNWKGWDGTTAVIIG